MPRSSDRVRKTSAVRFRVTEEEQSGLMQLARTMGQRPSVVLRRLLREALNGGPEYFADGLEEVRNAHRELAAVGRNFNQLVRALNAEDRAVPEEIRAEVAAVQMAVLRVERVYQTAVERIRKRSILRADWMDAEATRDRTLAHSSAEASS